MSFKKIAILISFITNLSYGQTNHIPVTTKSELARSHYYAGFASEDSGNLDLAEKSYRNAIKEDSSFALAYMALALVQTELVEKQKLIAKAMQFIDRVSEGEKYWIQGRNAFYGSGKKSDEFTSFQKFAASFPNDPVAQYLFGFVHHHHGRKLIQPAIEYLEKAIRLNPNYIAAYADLALAYTENKDFKNAERVIKENIRLQPDKASPLNTYAEFLLSAGRYEESILNYNKVLSLEPNHAWAYIGLAANYNFKNRHLYARSLLSNLSKLSLTERENWHFMIALECSYLDEGKLDSAIIAVYTHSELAKQRKHLTQQYIALTDLIKLHFENNNPVKGLASYQVLSDFAQTERLNEETKKLVITMKPYYLSYAAFLSGNMTDAISFLNQYENQKGRVDDLSRILRTKMLLLEKKETEALTLILQCDLNNPIVQFWLAKTYTSLGNYASAKETYQLIIEKNLMDHQDYHLVRRNAIANTKSLPIQ